MSQPDHEAIVNQIRTAQITASPELRARVREIAAQAPSQLAKGGLLALEIGADQGPATLGILEAHGYQELQLAKDLGGRDRVVSGGAPK